MRVSRLAALVVTACGGADDEPCPIDDPDGHGRLCRSAQVLAARYTAELTPTQPEVSHTLEVQCRAFEPLRATLGHPPTATAWTDVQQVTAQATDPQLVDAWRSGRVETGVALVDDVLARAHIDRVMARGGDFFALQSDYVLAPQNIDTALEGVPGLTLNEQLVRPTEAFSEVLLDYPEGLGGPIDVELSIGWGDCFVDCTGQHFWSVRVAGETATLTDEWGDQIPAEVLEVWGSPEPGC